MRCGQPNLAGVKRFKLLFFKELSCTPSAPAVFGCGSKRCFHFRVYGDNLHVSRGQVLGFHFRDPVHRVNAPVRKVKDFKFQHSSDTLNTHDCNN